VTPRGFRDVLAAESAERRAIARAVEGSFESAGYGLVETPVLETARTLEAGAGSSLEGRALFVQDTDGSLLALRPEMTVPIARLAAARLADTAGPKRLAYVADVFREQASLRGQARQFTQAGVEFIGAGGPAADAEVIVVLVAALEASGLEDFTVAVGTVAVLRALLATAGAGDEWTADVLTAAHRRDLVEFSRLVGGAALEPTLVRALLEVPRIRGGAEALDRCRALVAPCGCGEAVDDLAATVELLEAAGVADRVIVDFGVMRDFDYYTGLIVEAYAPGLGVPLGGGGRYDGVLATFDAPAPAAGFALGIERLHIALADQGRLPSLRGLDAVVGGPDANAVFGACALLRDAGWSVTPGVGASRAEIVTLALGSQATSALWAERASIGVLSPDGAVTGALDPADLPRPDAPARRSS
jgi:ATP phosphoribosyltransferase regulatory subunit